MKGRTPSFQLLLWLLVLLFSDIFWYFSLWYYLLLSSHVAFSLLPSWEGEFSSWHFSFSCLSILLTSFPALLHFTLCSLLNWIDTYSFFPMRGIGEHWITTRSSTNLFFIFPLYLSLLPPFIWFFFGNGNTANHSFLHIFLITHSYIYFWLHGKNHRMWNNNGIKKMNDPMECNGMEWTNDLIPSFSSPWLFSFLFSVTFPSYSLSFSLSFSSFLTLSNPNVHLYEFTFSFHSTSWILTQRQTLHLIQSIHNS